LDLRLILGPDTLMGAGKADLLEWIAETGSIAAAGRRMGMSYKRAWYLIDTINAYFGEPLVASARGGKAGGGARLTPMGESVLALYRRMEANAGNAIEGDLKTLTALASHRLDRKSGSA
jgi:molybdate transport system regulatory protein